MMSKEWDWMYFNDEWNEHDGSPIPFRKAKRFKNEIKRNKKANGRKLQGKIWEAYPKVA